MKERLSAFRTRYKMWEPVIFFTAGFLFDVFTLRRIDDWLKLCFQILFLILLGSFLLLQEKEERIESYVPPRLLKRIWPHQLEIVHFMFGSMLSAFVIFYFKSAAFSRSVVFLIFLIVLMILNELPQFRSQGLRLRLTLFSFSVLSFLIYFFPVVFGFIGLSLFLFAAVVSAVVSATLVFTLANRRTPDGDKIKFRAQLLRFGWPMAAVHFVLVAFYLLKIIPPVPLSLTFGGIYHRVEKENGNYKLYSLKPWYNFWGHGDSDFKYRDNEPVYCFVRIFAPSRFGQKVILHWFLYDERRGQYVEQDKIPMQISGGREEGFRGFAFKSHYQPGEWKVNVETEDDRVIGTISFNLSPDDSTADRVWMIEEN